MGFKDLKGKSFLEIIKYHYSNTHYERTEAQLKREEWLIPGVLRFNRFFLMPAAVLIQVCCGSLYAWSGFNQPIEIYILGIDPKTGFADRAISSNVFYLAIAIFGLTAALLGPWLERNGPFKGAILGASLFYLGNLLTGFGVYAKSFPLVFIGYGVVGGAGLGVSYISPVSPLQKWFPDLRGLAAGLAVCGFGAGSIFSPFTQKALFGAGYVAKVPVPNPNLPAGWALPLTFIILGSIYFVIMALAATVLRMPPPGYTVKGIDIHTIKGAENFNEAKTETAVTTVSKENSAHTIVTEVEPVADIEDAKIEDVEAQKKTGASMFGMSLEKALASKEFILMYIMFFCAELTGLLIISKIQSIVKDQLKKGTDVATTINSILGAVNLLGRLVIPLASDLLKTRKPFFIASLFCQTLFLGLLPVSIVNGSYGLTLTCAFIIAFFYGGGFGLIPAFLADQFGSKNVGATHGVILTAWSIAGVAGGLTFTAVYKSTVKHLTALHDAGQLGADFLLTSYSVDFQWILAFTILGFFIAISIPVNIRDRYLPKAPGEKHRMRGPTGRLIRFGPGMKVVSKEEEDKEWEEYLKTHHGIEEAK